MNRASEIWLALPNISVFERQTLLQKLKQIKLRARTLPTFSQLTNGKAHLSDIQELDINDLLHRDPVKPDDALLRKCIFQKTILITGAGGSIGSELCRQIITNQPKNIILADNSESALYNIHQELINFLQENNDFKNNKNNIDVILIPLLLDIQDSNKLKTIFSIWRPHTVYHAAAYKHVPMVEHNVVSGVKNNVFGTIKCANIAMEYNVKNFVLISTDKAVRPTNIMGASKRLAEIALQLLSEQPNNKTKFCMVRFGNVLGSSGSVVPLFKKQIDIGGPITLTHKNVTRYFMTITEASQLVIQAGAMSKGGEVFVLDMGDPIRIYDLAVKMIEAANLSVKDDKTPLGDIEIQTIGLRPGEKLYEELLIGNKTQGTKHPRILKAQENFISQKNFDYLMKTLEIHLEQNNVVEIKNLLRDNIYGFLPSKNDVDWISKFKN
jgi:FlaA1/EpsC-like NDP-sugar epimerase